ncbi:hypothetical protein BH23THE1_BH23THE1_08380 [soil metagenome]
MYIIIEASCIARMLVNPNGGKGRWSIMAEPDITKIIRPNPTKMS